MTSLSDLARKAGLLSFRGPGGVVLYTVGDSDIERLLALHVAELCADAEPVYQIENEWEEWCDFQQSDYETFAGNKRILYPATTVAALQARVAELEAALSDLLDAERFSNRPPETVMQAEEKLSRIRAAATKASEALRSKK